MVPGGDSRCWVCTGNWAVTPDEPHLSRCLCNGPNCQNGGESQAEVGTLFPKFVAAVGSCHLGGSQDEQLLSVKSYLGGAGLVLLPDPQPPRLTD